MHFCGGYKHVDDVASGFTGLFSKSICCLIATTNAGASLNKASQRTGVFPQISDNLFSHHPQSNDLF